ncbi:MAG TPA: S24 family peptidase [Pyrinomonadaceae bacterium]|nr:S24 family peptidase [Pyrinomonadaceae bacterium]
MPPQTKRQKEVLEIITRFIKNRGFKPSYQQIARELGVASKGGVAKHINALEEHGEITRRRENGHFVLELRSESMRETLTCEIEWLNIPRDNNLTEDFEFEPLFVPRFMLGSQDDERIQAFRITDAAMIDEQINEGDIILIERRGYARDGDTVVALVENSNGVCRKYYRSGAKIELCPANQRFESIILHADKIEIKGVLHSLLRPAR